MPYIKQEDRTPLNPLIDKLAEEIVYRSSLYGNEKTVYAGLLNYVCTRLVLKVIKLKFGEMRYWLIATTTGVFHNIADEFYRRMAAPYEDVQIEKNGDVDLYQEFDEAMTKR